MTGIVFASLTKKLEIDTLLKSVDGAKEEEKKQQQSKTGKGSGKKSKGDNGPTVKVSGGAAAA